MGSIFDDDDVDEGAAPQSKTPRNGAPLPGKKVGKPGTTAPANQQQRPAAPGRPSKPAPAKPTPVVRPRPQQPASQAPQRPALPAPTPKQSQPSNTAHLPSAPSARPALPAVPQYEPTSEPAQPQYQTPQQEVVATPPAQVVASEVRNSPAPTTITSIQRDDELPFEHESANGSKNGKNNKQRKTTKLKKQNPALAGGRGGVLLMRWGVIGGVILLAGLGVKSVVLPAQFPSQQQVIEAVQTGLELTDFPAERGNGFVLGFTESYLTYDPSEQEGRADDLAAYVPDGILTNLVGSFGDTAQSITEGPYVANTRFVDDNNAVYTVTARLNGGKWVTFDVPLYWDDKSSTLAVSGIPAFTGNPPLGAVPAQPVEWTEDEEATANFEDWVPTYFTAWAASDEASLLPLLDANANVRAKYGLNGTVAYGGMTDLKVSAPLDENDTSEAPAREARVTITWQVAGTGGGDKTPTTYQSRYQLLIAYNAAEQKWSISDIRGGVPEEESGAEAVDEDGEPIEEEAAAAE